MASVFITHGVTETERAGASLAPLLRAGDVVALAGDLGAGKTHLVQGVARELGVTVGVTSPTFNLLLVHRGILPLYHFDLYRLEGAHQLEDIGFFETIEADGVSFIEWGDRFPHMLPDDHVLVTMERGEGDERRIAVEASGPRGCALVHQWLSALGVGVRP